MIAKEEFGKFVAIWRENFGGFTDSTEYHIWDKFVSDCEWGLLMSAIDVISGNDKIRRPMLADLKRAYWKVAKKAKIKMERVTNEQTCGKCRDYGWVEILRAGKSAHDCPIQFKGKIFPAYYVSRGIIPCLCSVGLNANEKISYTIEMDILKKLNDRAAYRMGNNSIYEVSQKCLALGRKERDDQKKLEEQPEPEYNDIPF